MFLNLLPAYVWQRIKQAFIHWPGYLWAKCHNCGGEVWILVKAELRQYEPCSNCKLTGRVFMKKEQALLNHFEKENV